jgi:hypothetical protein
VPDGQNNRSDGKGGIFDKRILVSRILTTLSVVGMLILFGLITWRAYFFAKRVEAHLVETPHESEEDTLYEVSVGYNRLRSFNNFEKTDDAEDPRGSPAGVAGHELKDCGRGIKDTNQTKDETDVSELSNESFEVFQCPPVFPSKVILKTLMNTDL